MQGKSTVRNRAGRLALALSALIVAALALTATGTAADDTNVLIVYRAYQPGELTVVAGQTVLWRNSGLGPHTVTSDTGLFDSGKINAGETFTYTFTTPGSYSYSCTIHPTMHGKVAVLPAGSSPPGPPPAVHVSLSKTSGPRGRVTVVHVQVARPGAKLALQSQSPAGSWTTIARAQLGAGGRAKFTISASVHRKLRVVVRGPGAEPPVFSRAQRA
jgi:plastocyanin